MCTCIRVNSWDQLHGTTYWHAPPAHPSAQNNGCSFCFAVCKSMSVLYFLFPFCCLSVSCMYIRICVCLSGSCIYVSVCLRLSAADEHLPEEQRALLKWKMSPITPNVVRSCLTRVGFTKLKSEEREGGTAGTTPHLAAHHLASPPYWDSVLQYVVCTMYFPYA